MTDNQTLPINNPAERLFVILTKASQGDRNKTIIQVLSEAMEVEANPDTFIRNCSKLFGLTDIIEEAMKKHFPSSKPLKQTNYTSSLNDIRRCLSIAVKLTYDTNQSKWAFAKGLNDPNWLALNSLGGCVEDFEEYRISINKNSLNNLIKEVESLIKIVHESELDENLRNLVIIQLRNIKDILEKSYYYGSDGVKKEIYSALVEISMIQKVENEDNQQTEEEKKILRKIIEKFSEWLKLINPLLNTVAIADKLQPGMTQTAELISHAIKHLPPGN